IAAQLLHVHDYYLPLPTPSLPHCNFTCTLQPPCSTLFPYTTLFRSLPHQDLRVLLDVEGGQNVRDPRHRLRIARAKRDAEGHGRSEEHTSELQSLAYLVCRLLLEKKNNGNLFDHE